MGFSDPKLLVNELMEFYKKLDKIDCFDVSIKDDSFYCIPSKKDVVTKLMLATEEMYKIVTEPAVSKKQGNSYER